MTSSRRSFIGGAGALAVSFVAGDVASANTPPKSSPESYADPVLADEWMQRWMQAFAAASGTLHLGRFSDRTYFLLKPIAWAPNPGQKVMSVRIPKGFVTDFASVPRTFWSLLPPDGQYTYPAIIHDYLYWEQPCKRDEADLIFKYAMQEFKVGSFEIATIYAGVRAGGEAAWHSNAKLKSSGEQRILKCYPDDPKVRWNEWKKKTGVFDQTRANCADG